MEILSQREFGKQLPLIGKLGEGNAYLVWSLALFLDHPDPVELASQCLTDGKNDKKIDFICLDLDAKQLVFAQGYFSRSKGGDAPANKASDLNTAAAWLFSGDLSLVPSNLREIIKQARAAIEGNEIEEIVLLYVHNLPESINVSRELQTVQSHLEGFLKTTQIKVSYKEIGIEQIERLYSAKGSAIEIKETIICPAAIKYQEAGPNWRAATLTVPGTWIREIFHKHGDSLFSANYRGFLGINKRRKINTGIRQTAENEPDNFWVYNNGITILTLGFQETKQGLSLNGISIINGAQTTGSIGSTDSTKHPLSGVKTLCRVIECSDPKTVGQIIRYTNTQNEITTWDLYSNDETQKRIQKEFADLNHAYSLKRGFEAASDELGIEQVAQSTLALEGSFQDANRGKNSIFERPALYRQAFDGKKARHILFAFSLAKAIDNRRLELKQKNAATLIDIELKQLNLFQNLRFKNFCLALIGKALDVIVGSKVDLKEVCFDPQFSKQSLNDLIAIWSPIINSVLAYLATTVKGDIAEVLSDDKAGAEVSNTINGLLYSGTVAGGISFDQFRRVVIAQP